MLKGRKDLRKPRAVPCSGAEAGPLGTGEALGRWIVGVESQAASRQARPMVRNSASRASLSAWAALRSLTAWAMASSGSKVMPG